VRVNKEESAILKLLQNQNFTATELANRVAGDPIFNWDYWHKVHSTVFDMAKRGWIRRTGNNRTEFSK